MPARRVVKQEGSPSCRRLMSTRLIGPTVGIPQDRSVVYPTVVIVRVLRGGELCLPVATVLGTVVPAKMVCLRRVVVSNSRVYGTPAASIVWIPKIASMALRWCLLSGGVADGWRKRRRCSNPRPDNRSMLDVARSRCLTVRAEIHRHNSNRTCSTPPRVLYVVLDADNKSLGNVRAVGREPSCIECMRSVLSAGCKDFKTRPQKGHTTHS